MVYDKRPSTRQLTEPVRVMETPTNYTETKVPVDRGLTFHEVIRRVKGLVKANDATDCCAPVVAGGATHSNHESPAALVLATVTQAP